MHAEHGLQAHTLDLELVSNDVVSNRQDGRGRETEVGGRGTLRD